MARFMDVHNDFVGVTGEQSREAYPPGRMSSPVYWLSFRRITGVPFETCVATLESWRRTGQDGELRMGQSRLRWPIEHDRESGTCRLTATQPRVHQDARLEAGPGNEPVISAFKGL